MTFNFDDFFVAKFEFRKIFVVRSSSSKNDRFSSWWWLTGRTCSACHLGELEARSNLRRTSDNFQILAICAYIILSRPRRGSLFSRQTSRENKTENLKKKMDFSKLDFLISIFRNLSTLNCSWSKSLKNYFFVGNKKIASVETCLVAGKP